MFIIKLTWLDFRMVRPDKQILLELEKYGKLGENCKKNCSSNLLIIKNILFVKKNLLQLPINI